MLNYLVNAENGLTPAGYAVSAASALFLYLAAGLAGRTRSRKKTPVKQLAFCGAAMALAFLASYVQVVHMPFGGSVTLFSMLFISLIGYWYGLKAGLLTCLAYGILQFLQEPFVLSPLQVGCDYVLAFAALGLSGLFSRSRHGLIKGYVLGVLARGIFHVIGGYLYWMDYMPDNFPPALASVYPIVYNYSYLLAEGAMTLIVVLLPPMGKALEQIRKLARE